MSRKSSTRPTKKKENEMKTYGIKGNGDGTASLSALGFPSMVDNRLVVL